MTGTVLFISPKGWGFLRPDEPSDAPDLYYHRSALVGLTPRDIVEGLRVSYDLGERNGKTLALNVRRFQPGTAAILAAPVEGVRHE